MQTSILFQKKAIFIITQTSIRKGTSLVCEKKNHFIFVFSLLITKILLHFHSPVFKDL